MSDARWNPFSRLTTEQRDQLAAFQDHLLHFNRRFNLISRETEGLFRERHLLHTLAFLYKGFPGGSAVVDWGTGGGLPAIPLAVSFPDVAVYAVDSVEKKIRAVEAMGRRLGLRNLHPWHGRAEDWPGAAHFSVSRATAPLCDLWRWHGRVSRPLDASLRAPVHWRPGLICLKGGDLTDEIAALREAYPGIHVETMPLEQRLGRPYYAEKYIVEVFDDE